MIQDKLPQQDRADTDGDAGQQIASRSSKHVEQDPDFATADNNDGSDRPRAQASRRAQKRSPQQKHADTDDSDAETIEAESTVQPEPSAAAMKLEKQSVAEWVKKWGPLPEKWQRRNVSTSTLKEQIKTDKHRARIEPVEGATSWNPWGVKNPGLSDIMRVGARAVLTRYVEVPRPLDPGHVRIFSAALSKLSEEKRTMKLLAEDGLRRKAKMNLRLSQPWDSADKEWLLKCDLTGLTLASGEHIAEESCPCGRRDTEEEMVECACCEAWHHYGCVGVNADSPEIQEGVHWRCPPCIQAAIGAGTIGTSKQPAQPSG